MVASAMLYKSVKTIGNPLIVYFESASVPTSLMDKHGKPTDFEIAGVDKIFIQRKP
ncbi:hypothetical protein ACVWYG_000616 [Pedobacter sp. UYEF25]